MTHPPIDSIIRAATSIPWALQPEKLDAMIEILSLRSKGIKFTSAERAERLADSGRNKVIRSIPAGVTVIPVIGVIGHRFNMFDEISGGTSIEKLHSTFNAAMADDSIRTIIFDVDSPGGSVEGVPELAQHIFNSRGKGKHIIAIANTLAASAGYWLPSAADEIVVTPSGEVGSIGVYMLHSDYSQAAEDAGVKYTYIKAGKYKTDGNPFEPLGDDARSYLQTRVDEYYDMFVKAVGRHRGRTVAEVKSGFGEGRVVGARQAVELGMADRIGTLDDTLDKLRPRKLTSRGRAEVMIKKLELDD